MTLLTVIQFTALTAFHEQFVPLITESALVLPIDDTDTLVGVTVAVHWASAARASIRNTSASRTQRYRGLMEFPLVPVAETVGPRTDGLHIPSRVVMV